MKFINMEWKIGQKVVSISDWDDSASIKRARADYPKKGEVYTITKISSKFSIFDGMMITGLCFKELNSKNSAGYDSRDFKPLEELSKDEEIYIENEIKELLTETIKKVN